MRTAVLPATVLQAAEMHMFTCIYFFATHNQHANSSGQAAGKKIKKCIHYIYTKYPFFMFKKCIHYIYTRNHTSSRQQPFQRLHHYSPTPQICRQQAEIWQITTNHYCSPTKIHTHILQAAELSIQRSKAKATTRPPQHDKKGYTLTQPQAYTYFFAHFSRFLQNGKQEAYIRPQKKKEKKGIKRY